jgi:hypothetical protein
MDADWRYGQQMIHAFSTTLIYVSNHYTRQSPASIGAIHNVSNHYTRQSPASIGAIHNRQKKWEKSSLHSRAILLFCTLLKFLSLYVDEHQVYLQIVSYLIIKKSVK